VKDPIADRPVFKYEKYGQRIIGEAWIEIACTWVIRHQTTNDDHFLTKRLVFIRRQL
jgi:hypothetical protein